MNIKKIKAMFIASVMCFSYIGFTGEGLGDILKSRPLMASAAEEKNAQGYVKLDTLKEDPNAPEPKKSKNKGVTYFEGVMIANKTYDLPSDYAPEDMHKDSTCALGNGFNGTNGLDATTYNQAIKMMKAAEKDGITLKVVSGYRSYERQKELYDYYVGEKGKDGADNCSARPGYSEHQTGLCLDFNDASSNFDNSAEAKWLENHAHEYGFIIRYPNGKTDVTGYKYESWHVRYLGGSKAKAVHDAGVTLEEYLGLTSKYGDTKKSGDSLDAPVCDVGGTGAGSSTTWKKSSAGDGDVSDWLSIKDDWRHGVYHESSGGGEDGSGSGHSAFGKATGQYAIELNDGK